MDRLAVSNVGWKKGIANLPEFFAILRHKGIENLELSVTSIWENPEIVKKSDVVALKEMANEFDIKIISMHSLTFSRPELEIFNGAQKQNSLVEYFKKISEIAELLDVKSITFGSPKCRLMHSKSIIECNDIFVSFLEKIDPIFEGIKFCVEPLPVQWCEYLNSTQEAVDIVHGSGTENIFVQLDSKTYFDSGWPISVDPKKYKKLFAHVQVSDPQMLPVSDKNISLHEQFKSFLGEIAYSGAISHEALLPDGVEVDALFDRFIDIYRRREAR